MKKVIIDFFGTSYYEKRVNLLTGDKKKQLYVSGKIIMITLKKCLFVRAINILTTNLDKTS